MNIDIKKVGFAAVGVLVAIGFGWLRTRIPGAEGYVANLVVTIFAVLAGFLSVVLNMVLIARPSNFKSRTAQKQYRGRLLRHSAIFYCYLLILGCVFSSELVRPYWPGTGRLLEAVYCGLAAAGLLWSFTVPNTLAKMHEEQIILTQETQKP